MTDRDSAHLQQTYTLSNPLIEIEIEGKPSRVFVAAFYAVGVLLALLLLYAYAVVLPSFVGFETAVLVGIAAIALGDSP